MGHKRPVERQHPTMESVFQYFGVSGSLVVSVVIAVAVFTPLVTITLPLLAGN